MNPHAPVSLSLRSLVRSLWANRALIWQLAVRDVLGRYKGSAMGVLWSFLTPLLLLATYTFVFSGVFKARWAGQSESTGSFAVLLFAGMIVHGFFSEVLVRAPMLVVSNVSYVKKIVFPLEILGPVLVMSSLFHAAVSSVVLFFGVFLTSGGIKLTTFLLPLVFMPIAIIALGVAWLMCSLGVYVRDVSHPVGLISTMLLFCSPVFYPVSALPPMFQGVVALNPLSFVIEQVRNVVIFGVTPDLLSLLLYSLISLSVSWLGYAWFQKTRKGFSNVL